MEQSIIKNCVTKLKLNDILTAIQRWNLLENPDASELTGKTKASIAAQLIDVCSNEVGFSADKCAELDLICLQMNSSKRQWNAYQLTEKQVSSKTPDKKIVPDKFKGKLSKLVRLYFNKDCSVSVMLHNGLMWGRAYLPRPGVKVYQPARCLYFVHYPDTPILIMTGMKAAYNNFISRCLVVALGYREVRELNLTGHHMESVAELAINKHCQGGLTRFQLTQRLNGPINTVTSKKRKAPVEDSHPNIIDENRAEKRQRLDHLNNSFGEFVLPTLEKIEYRVELPFRGKEIAKELRSDTELFHSRVKFRGSSVLEGLRNLGEKGYAAVPLAKHLTCVPSRARNYFLLSKPQKQPSQNSTSSTS